MSVSVIIPTYNGAEKIIPLLISLTEQVAINFEVVVVVDGSTDRTLDVIAEFSNRFGSWQVIVQENQGRASARNKGAQAAQGDLFIFVDDDITLTPDNIDHHINFQRQNPETLFFGNACLEAISDPIPDFHQYRMYIENSAKGKIKDKGLVKIGPSNYCFTTQNLSLSKKLFEQLGGFDNRLRDGEDLDLSLKALLKEKEIFFDKNLIVAHRDQITIQQHIQRQRQYAISKEQLLKIHPEYLSLLPSFFLWRRNNWKDQLKYLFLGNYSFWISKLESAAFLALPQKIRHFVYSAFIQVHSVAWVRKNSGTK